MYSNVTNATMSTLNRAIRQIGCDGSLNVLIQDCFAGGVLDILFTVPRVC